MSFANLMNLGLSVDTISSIVLNETVDIHLINSDKDCVELQIGSDKIKLHMKPEDVECFKKLIVDNPEAAFNMAMNKAVKVPAEEPRIVKEDEDKWKITSDKFGTDSGPFTLTQIKNFAKEEGINIEVAGDNIIDKDAEEGSSDRLMGHKIKESSLVLPNILIEQDSIVLAQDAFKVNDLPIDLTTDTGLESPVSLAFEVPDDLQRVKELLDKAGIPYKEVFPQDTPQEPRDLPGEPTEPPIESPCGETPSQEPVLDYPPVDNLLGKSKEECKENDEDPNWLQGTEVELLQDLEDKEGEIHKKGSKAKVHWADKGDSLVMLELPDTKGMIGIDSKYLKKVEKKECKESQDTRKWKIVAPEYKDLGDDVTIRAIQNKAKENKDSIIVDQQDKIVDMDKRRGREGYLIAELIKDDKKGDMFKESEDKKEVTPATEVEKNLESIEDSKEYKAGYKACKAGKDKFKDNPYTVKEQGCRDLWNNGFDHAQADLPKEELKKEIKKLGKGQETVDNMKEPVNPVKPTNESQLKEGYVKDSSGNYHWENDSVKYLSMDKGVQDSVIKAKQEAKKASEEEPATKDTDKDKDICAKCGKPNDQTDKEVCSKCSKEVEENYAFESLKTAYNQGHRYMLETKEGTTRFAPNINALQYILKAHPTGRITKLEDKIGKVTYESCEELFTKSPIKSQGKLMESEEPSKVMHKFIQMGKYLPVVPYKVEMRLHEEQESPVLHVFHKGDPKHTKSLCNLVLTQWPHRDVVVHRAYSKIK